MPANVETSSEVLVTDGQTRAGLAVARSLAKRGVRLLVLASEPGCPAFHSQLLKNVVLSPSAGRDPRAFMEFTLEKIRQHGVQLAIPITDQALLLFEQCRDRLESVTKVAMAKPPALRSAQPWPRRWTSSRRPKETHEHLE